MEYYIAVDRNGAPYIAHHGIKGQRWGVRRYQNPDGSLTNAGKHRYSTESADATKKTLNKIERQNAKLITKSAMLKVKAEKAYQKGNDKKQEKLKNKASEIDKAVKDGKVLADKFVSDAKKKGYHVESKDVNRYARAGQLLASGFLAGPTGVIAVGALHGYRTYKYGAEAGGIVAGKKYKVTR